MRPILLFSICLLSLFGHLQAQPGKDPEPYYIFSIYFGGGSYYIDPELPDAYRKYMSRSERAFQKLIEKGIPKDQILLKDFGELNPLYDNNSCEGRRKNRRVDIIVKPLVL